MDKFISFHDYSDIIDELISMSEDWTNQWAYQDGYEKLIQAKDYALSYKDEIRAWGFDIEDVYRQLEDFEKCVAMADTITGSRDEAIILSAIQYAEKGKTIVYRRWIPEKKRNDSFYMTDLNLFLDKLFFDTKSSLFYFYVNNKNNLDCINYLKKHFTKFLDARESYLKLHKKNRDEFYCTPLVIAYCKILIKQKEIEKAKFILDTYTLESIGKTDTTNLEKIKQKIYKEKT